MLHAQPWGLPGWAAARQTRNVTMETEKSKYLRTTSCQSAGDHASHTLARIPQGHPSGPALSTLYLFLKLLPNITARKCLSRGSGGISQQCKPHRRWQPVSEFLWAWAQLALIHHLLSQSHKKACIPFRQNHVLKHGRPVFSLSPQVLRNPPTLCFSRNELRLSSALSPLLRSP